MSLVDDTDFATLAAIRPVYDLLTTSGIRVTKTVWPLPPVGPSGWLSGEQVGNITATLQDQGYRRFCQELQGQGHEVAMHTASAGDNSRDRTIEAYALFESTFGHPPYTNIMHGKNRENIYWGRNIFHGRLLRRIMAMFDPQQFSGHDPASPFYWGDICRTRTRYVRLLETLRLNTRAFDPATPFHDNRKPDVQWWFSSTYCNDLRSRFTTKAIEQLRNARGAAILHTYCVLFAELGPDDDYLPTRRFIDAVGVLTAQPDGWYVPVVELLDRLRAVRNVSVLEIGRSVVLRNNSDTDIQALALSAPGPVGPILQLDGCDLALRRNGLGQIPLGDLPSGGTLHLHIASGNLRLSPARSSEPDYFKLFLGSCYRVLAGYLKGERQAILIRRLPRFLSILPARIRQ